MNAIARIDFKATNDILSLSDHLAQAITELEFPIENPLTEVLAMEALVNAAKQAIDFLHNDRVETWFAIVAADNSPYSILKGKNEAFITPETDMDIYRHRMFLKDINGDETSIHPDDTKRCLYVTLTSVGSELVMTPHLTSMKGFMNTARVDGETLMEHMAD